MGISLCDDADISDDDILARHIRGAIRMVFIVARDNNKCG